MIGDWLRHNHEDGPEAILPGEEDFNKAAPRKDGRITKVQLAPTFAMNPRFAQCQFRCRRHPDPCRVLC